MPRSCPCERWLIFAAGNAAFRLLPLPVRALWHELLAFAAAAPEKGVLRFEASVPASVSQLIGVAETDVETGLRRLAAAGMLEVDGAANALFLPGVKAGNARAQAARINGLKGGRPPKARVAGQAEILLPIAGAAPATEPRAEPKGGADSSTTSSPSFRNSSPPTLVTGSGGSRGAKPAHADLGEELARIAGLDPVGLSGGFGPVRAWLERGWPREAILRAVQRDVARDSYDPRKITTFGYFTRAIERALAEPAATAAALPAAGLTALERQMRAWQAGGCNGPMPRAA